MEANGVDDFPARKMQGPGTGPLDQLRSHGPEEGEMVFHHLETSKIL